MCQPARCKQCGKTTWTGCGRHVADVRATVPADQWCPGHDSPGDNLGAEPVNDSWLRRILGGKES